MSIRINSDAFPPGDPIPVRYTQDGANTSPPLRWSNVPAGTEELALICEDPDAPRAEPFVHWVVYHISPDADGLPEGIPQQPLPHHPPEVRGVAQGENSKHDLGYDGPSPPPGHGVHHYHFRLYALDRPLQVDAKLDSKALIASMSGHILDTGELVGTYERPA